MADPTPEAATALALTQGQCDIDSGDTYNDHLAKAVAGGAGIPAVSWEDVDRALFNSLKQRFDLGLFDGKEAYAWPTNDDVGTVASSALSLEASEKSIVLLRNDNDLLPLEPGKKVAVIGPHGNATTVMMQPYPFSPFCADKTLGCIVSPVEAIATQNSAAERPKEGESWTRYAPACDLFNTSKAGFDAALALAKEADVIVLALGIETCGMNPEHNVNPQRPGQCYQEKPTTGYVFPDQYLELEAHDRTTIDLPQIQHDLFDAVMGVGKPTVLVLMNAGAVAIDREAAYVGSDKAPLAIIEAFYPGPHGGTALARGMYGSMNAWGRLPYTIYPKKFETETDMSEHDLRRAPGRTYRYYRDPLWRFGEGLTLTNWSLSLAAGTPAAPSCLGTLPTDASGPACRVEIEVKNTGTRDGDAVVMAYWRSSGGGGGGGGGDNGSSPPPSSSSPSSSSPSPSAAAAGGGELLTPLRQLFDFERVTVAAGCTVSVTFNVTARKIAAYADNGDQVADAGSFALTFEDGGGARVDLEAKMVGARTVLETFPSDKP